MCFDIACTLRKDSQPYIIPIVVGGICMYTALFVVAVFQWECEAPDLPQIPGEWLILMQPFTYEIYSVEVPELIERTFICGWPISNTIFRALLLMIALINACLALISHLATSNCKCFRSLTKWMFFLITPLLTGSCVLDADKVYNSDKFCNIVLADYSNIKCAPSSRYAANVFGMFLCTCFTMASFMVLYNHDKEKWLIQGNKKKRAKKNAVTMPNSRYQSQMSRG